MARRPEEGTDDVTRVQSTDRSDARGDQLAQAFEVIRQHDPSRIVTLGSECAVSVAPFFELARRYGDDLAIVSPDRVALVGLHVWAEDDIGQCGPIGDPRLQPG
jgi:hypothetical protein